MIKNEKQYKITKKKILGIKEKIAQMSTGNEPAHLKDQLILASLINFQKDLEEEISAYDLLSKNKSITLDERIIDDLPLMLIEFKLSCGLTQKEFSKKIGMKEQQLQRYEAENFKSISFKNLIKILHSVGLEIKIKGAVIGKMTKAIAS
ncbi:helix-turn-helix domain-containing protein [Flavitalea flava]